MEQQFVTSIPLPDTSLWKKMKKADRLTSFELELTARCNNNCRHCYINLPAGDRAAKERELSFGEIKEIVDEAVSLGAVWCLATGGEPLIREDFFDIYMYLKKKGLLVSVFTNASLMRNEHAAFFKRYPPRDLEVTVYGVSLQAHQAVTRAPGSFSAFLHGLDALKKQGVPVRLKAMALRSNVSELPEIAIFCRENTKDYFRFDPFLNLRYDRDPHRNREIQSERLSPEDIVAVETSDPKRMKGLAELWKACAGGARDPSAPDLLLQCGAGRGHFSISYDGAFRLCASLCHPDCVYDLRRGTLSDAFLRFAPQVRALREHGSDHLRRCRGCAIIDFCQWCPAHAFLETGKMEGVVDYFCEVAHARARMLEAAP